MSKQSSNDAKSYLEEFKEFFSSSDFTGVDIALAIGKELNNTILTIILKKYDSSDEKIGFDPSARTMFLILMRIIYYSANSNDFDSNADPSKFWENFEVGEIQYNLWTWIGGLIKDNGGWETAMAINIHEHLDEVSVMHIDSKTNPIDADVAVLAHTIFALIFDMLGSKMARLYYDTTAKKASGIIVYGSTLQGLFTDMNPGAANPELFTMLHNAATSFLVVKKEWAAESKALKKKNAAAQASKKQGKINTVSPAEVQTDESGSIDK
jgi:hypothetical protein